MKKARCSPLVLVLAVGTISHAKAAAADEASELGAILDEPIVSTASKSSESAGTAPATSSVIMADDLRRYGIRSLDEALDFLSLGMMTSNPLHEVDVGARGVVIAGDQGRHLLLLVDGHAMNEPLLGSARFERGAGIPFEIVDHIEVILGPGSVLYGSNAMFGVINVVTKRAKDFSGSRIIAESEIGKSYRVAAGSGYGFTLFGHPGEVTLALDYYRQNGPVYNFGPQGPFTDTLSYRPAEFTRESGATGYWGGRAERSYYASVPSALGRVVWRNVELSLGGSLYERAAPYIGGALNTIGDFDDPHNRAIDRSVWADARYSTSVSSLLRMSFRGYADARENDRHLRYTTAIWCYWQNVRTCRGERNGSSQWAGAEAQALLDWAGDASLVTTLGADARVVHVAARYDDFDADTGRPVDRTRNVIDRNDAVAGIYLQQVWQPSYRLNINAGSRLDVGRVFDPVLSPRLAASGEVWPGGTLKVSFSRAFRAPTWQEREGENRLLWRSDNLRPEYVQSVEASLSQRIGRSKLLFGMFRSVWSDLIELYVLRGDEIQRLTDEGVLDGLKGDGFGQYRNITSVENYGYNASFEGVFSERLRYAINVTGAVASRSSEMSKADRLTVAPQFFGNARVSYDLGSALPTLALAAHAIGPRLAEGSIDRSSTYRPTAPPQLELRATASGPVPGVRGLSYRVTANYAFSDRAPYLAGPARNWFVATDGAPGAYELAPADRFRIGTGAQYEF